MSVLKKFLKIDGQERMRVPKQQGFTLLELLVAMTLMATVITALFGLFTNVIDASQHMRAKIEGGQVGRTIASIVEDDLRFLHTALGGKQFRFRAKPLSTAFDDTAFLAFTTSSSLDYRVVSRQADLQNVEYVLRRNDTKTQSFIRREKRHATVSGEFDWIEFELIENVQSLQLAFYDSDTKEFKKEWGVERSGIPSAIRFTIAFGEEGNTKKYTFLVKLPQGEI